MSNEDLIEKLTGEGYAVKTICDTLQISRSSYYRKVDRCADTGENDDANDEKLLELIKSIKTDHHYWGYRG
jgi:transposase